MSQQRQTQTTTVVEQGQTCPICFEEFVLTNEKQQPPQQQQQQEQEEVAIVLVTSDDDDDDDDNQQQQQPTPFPLTACHHTFCVPCLVTHVTHSVETKRMPLVCPQVGCRAEIAKDTLEALVRKHDGKENPVGSSSSSSSSSGRMNKIVQQVERLTELGKNTDKIPCTKCDTLIQPQTSSSSSSPSSTKNSNVLTCPACAHVFCRWHGDMHRHLSCAAFLQTDAGQQWQQSERVLRQFTKPCSRCGALLQKAAGCDYVVCGHCRGDMCWHCATHQHLQGETFRRCTSCRSTYHNQVRLPAIVGCFLMIVVMVFTLTLIVVWPALAAVFVLASGCCGCCFQCGRRLDSSTKSSSPSQDRDDPLSSPSQQQHPYKPVRGILAVVVILFLPLAMLLDGAIMMVRGTEEGFLDRLLPGLSGKVEEIPTLELGTASTPRTVLTTAENEEDDREADLEQGLVVPCSGDDDDDDNEHEMPDGS